MSMLNLWPEIEDLNAARQATKQGWKAAFFVGGMTILAATGAMLTGRPVAGIDGSAYIDAILVGFVGWRVLNYSKTWAVVGLSYWIYNIAYKLLDPRPILNFGGGFVSLVILLALINGVRGVWAYHRLKQPDPGVATALSVSAN